MHFPHPQLAGHKPVPGYKYYPQNFSVIHLLCPRTKSLKSLISRKSTFPLYTAKVWKRSSSACFSQSFITVSILRMSCCFHISNTRRPLFRIASVYSITIKRVMIARIRTKGSAICTRASFGLSEREFFFFPRIKSSNPCRLAEPLALPLIEIDLRQVYHRTVRIAQRHSLRPFYLHFYPGELPQEFNRILSLDFCPFSAHPQTFIGLIELRHHFPHLLGTIPSSSFHIR